MGSAAVRHYGSILMDARARELRTCGHTDMQTRGTDETDETDETDGTDGTAFLLLTAPCGYARTRVWAVQ